MQISPYLSFKGNCEAAFNFYERCLGGRARVALPIRRVAHGGSGPGRLVGQDDARQREAWRPGADGRRRRAGPYEEPKGFSLSLQIEDTAEAERIFHELARDGTVVMPLEKTFWAERFGMVIDRFGIPWLINCGG